MKARNGVLFSSLATLFFLACRCSKAPNYTPGSGSSFGTNPMPGSYATYSPTPTPYVTAAPTPITGTSGSSFDLSNQIGFSNNGAPLVPVAPPSGAQTSGSAYFQVTAGQIVNLNLGVAQIGAGGTPIQAGAAYQIVAPNGAGVKILSASPTNPKLASCMPPQGVLSNGTGSVCLQFTQGTAPTAPIPVIVNVTQPGTAQVTATLYVAVNDVLSPTVSLLRTCGRVARQSSATVSSPSIMVSFEVIAPGLPPMLLLNTEINNGNLYNQAGVLQPAALDLDDVSLIANYESLPVQINACVSQGPGTSCAAVCNNPATLSACISRGTTSLATSSGYYYQPVTVPLGSLLHPAASAPPIPLYLLSNHAAPSGYSANQVVVGNQYCNLVSPLALTFHKGFPQTNMTTGRAPIFFDINADGHPQAMDFLNDPQAAFLVLPDANGNVTSGAQLFGPASLDLSTGKPGHFDNGFDALDQYVPAGTRRLRPGDPIWSKLRLWFANGNPTAKPEELKTLDQMNVLELSLSDHGSSQTNDAGDAFKQISFFRYLDQSLKMAIGKFVDIWFTSY